MNWLGHATIYVAASVCALVGLIGAIVAIVWGALLPPWVHLAVEAIGWWFLAGLLVAWVWSCLMRAIRRREEALANVRPSA